MQLFYTLIQDPLYIRLIASVVVIFTFIVTKRLLYRMLITALSKVEFRSKRLDIHMFDRLQKPIYYLFLLTGVYIALSISPFVYYQTPFVESTFVLGELEIPLSLISGSLLKCLYNVSFVLLITWIIYDLEHIYEQLFSDFNMRVTLTDNTLFIRYMARIIRILTVLVGILIAVVTAVPDLSRIMTGVGIGGAALALISKDTLANLLSGLTLLLDKPFVIGDWIELNNIEGIVEDISFRSARIRTFTQGVVVIPNATISTANVVNWSHMPKRRVKFDLGVTYDTSLDQLHQCTQAFKEAISTHPLVESDTVLVHFENFGDYALNIQMIYFTTKTDYASYVAIKEAINLRLLEICHQQGVEIAFPTQTVVLPTSSSS